MVRKLASEVTDPFQKNDLIRSNPLPTPPLSNSPIINPVKHLHPFDGLPNRMKEKVSFAETDYICEYEKASNLSFASENWDNDASESEQQDDVTLKNTKYNEGKAVNEFIDDVKSSNQFKNEKIKYYAPKNLNRSLEVPKRSSSNYVHTPVAILSMDNTSKAKADTISSYIPQKSNFNPSTSIKSSPSPEIPESKSFKAQLAVKSPSSIRSTSQSKSLLQEKAVKLSSTSPSHITNPRTTPKTSITPIKIQPLPTLQPFSPISPIVITPPSPNYEKRPSNDLNYSEWQDKLQGLRRSNSVKTVDSNCCEVGYGDDDVLVAGVDEYYHYARKNYNENIKIGRDFPKKKKKKQRPKGEDCCSIM